MKVIEVYLQCHVQAEDEANKTVGQKVDRARQVDPENMQLASVFLEKMRM